MSTRLHFFASPAEVAKTNRARLALERKAYPEGECVPRMRVGAVDVAHICAEHLEMSERARHVEANFKVVVSNHPIELHDFLVGIELGRAKPAVGALPREDSAGGQLSHHH